MDEQQTRNTHTAALLQRIRAGRKGHEPATWPGSDLVIRIRVASDEDKLEALAGAVAEFKRRELPTDNLATHETFEAEVGRQLIALVVEQADPSTALKGDPLERHDPLFLDAAQVRTTVHEQDRRWLLREIARISNAAAPDMVLTDDQFELISEAAKKKQAALLRALDSSLLVSFILRSASRASS
jgi:hypothetical protein